MISQLPPEALVLETDRLKLRPFTEDDIDIANEVLTDSETMKYVTGEPLTEGQVAAEMHLVTRRGAGGRLGIWCAELKDTGEKIGDGVLTPIPIELDDTDWMSLVPDAYPPDQIEVGYLLKRSAWGRGYATEICKRLLRFAFEQTKLDVVVACTDPENAASQHVLRKSGMYDYGMGRAYLEEVSWFELPRSDWLASQA